MRIDHSKTVAPEQPAQPEPEKKPVIVEPVRIYQNGSGFVAIDSAGQHIGADPSDIILALQLTRLGIVWEFVEVEDGK